MSRNISQTEINRRKKVSAELTRTTSAIGLGSLAALGASKGRARLAGGRLLPKVNPEKAQAFHNSVKDKLFVTGLVGSGIGGANGFNNASIQSAESRQRKKPVVKSAPSPFEDGFYGSETFAKGFNPGALKSLSTGDKVAIGAGLGAAGVTGAAVNSQIIKPARKVARQQVAKGIGDWKTIDQRERTQARSRKTMRRAGAVASLGAGVAAVGIRGGGGPGARNVARIAGLNAKSSGKLGTRAARIGRATRFHVEGNHDTGLVLGGAGVAGAATATAAGAKGHHTYQQHKINQRRRDNFKKSAVSAFGIVHD